MKQSFLLPIFFLAFIALFCFFYFIEIELSADVDRIFLTIATFLFSMIVGFFIARQGVRYSGIREQISLFDGHLSAIYRESGHLGKKAQEHIGEIILDYYKKNY